MKTIYKKIGVIAFILYVAGIFITAFLLYKLPDNILKGSTGIGTEDITQIYPVLLFLNIITGTTLLVGLLAAIFLWLLSGDSQFEDFTYTESFAKVKKDKDVDTEKNEEEHTIDGKHLDAFREIIKAEKSKEDAGTKILSALCRKLEASQAALYSRSDKGKKRLLHLFASYAFILPESETLEFEFGEGLVGQAAREGKSVNIKSVPDGYIRVFSGLGNSTPNYLLLIPIKEKDGNVVGIAEIASFTEFSGKDQKLAEEIFSLLAPKLTTPEPGKKIKEEK